MVFIWTSIAVKEGQCFPSFPDFVSKMDTVYARRVDRWRSVEMKP